MGIRLQDPLSGGRWLWKTKIFFLWRWRRASDSCGLSREEDRLSGFKEKDGLASVLSMVGLDSICPWYLSADSDTVIDDLTVTLSTPMGLTLIKDKEDSHGNP